MTESNRPRHALDDSADDENLGLPLRGLAMILLAVAVLLIGWGVFSMTSKDSEESPQASQSQQSQPSQQGQPDQKGQQGQQVPAKQDASATSPSESDKPKPEDEQGSRENASAADRGEGEAAGAEGSVNKENTYVAVLNNSPIAGLAGDVANKMRDQGPTVFTSVKQDVGVDAVIDLILAARRAAGADKAGKPPA